MPPWTIVFYKYRAGMAGRGAIAPGGAGPKAGTPDNFEIRLGFEMGPSMSGGSKVEGT